MNRIFLSVILYLACFAFLLPGLSAAENEPKAIDIHDDLFKIKERLSPELSLVMKVLVDLRVNYNQTPKGSYMRPVIFQDGKTLTNDDPRDLKKSWCMLRVEIKLDENTLIPKNHLLKITEVDIPTDNPSTRFISFNFFDFESGKKSGETSRFIPFNFQCSIPKDSKLELGDFRQITGGRVDLIFEKIPIPAKK